MVIVKQQRIHKTTTLKPTPNENKNNSNHFRSDIFNSTNFTRMNKTEILQKAVDTYGINNQLNQLQEECAELIVAVNKYRRTPFDNLDGLVDEFADVIIMHNQIINKFNLEVRVHERIEFKLNRLKERLENE